MRWLTRRPRNDSGVTLVELSISILLMGVISAFVAGSVVSVNKIFRTGDDQSRGLSEVRVAAERLARDVRDARSVLCNPAGTDATLAAADPNCQFHLQLWIDSNSDYVQQTSETITWKLQSGTEAGHYNLVRSVNGSTQVEASAIVKQLAFAYCENVTATATDPTSCDSVVPPSTTPGPGAAQAKVINVDMTYDALYQLSKSSNRTISFSGRLRNVS